ncbi:MAG: site-specific DNA-methyltransferase [Planctomycetota bacterium]|nr:site-specific DNA-methyltransferase [Planctomycetota bacterium]
MAKSKRAERNRTLSIIAGEISRYKKRLIRLQRPAKVGDILNKTICQDIFEAAEFLPHGFADLLFIDPPYNLDKKFNVKSFRKKTLEDYAGWVDVWLGKLVKILKPTASIYICSDWRSSTAVHEVAQKYFKVRNRITWEREKGRGALSNWKNCSEDIWFCTMSGNFTFNSDAVKIKRKVIAPYTENGRPKDWEKSEKGNFRLTFPSNMWTDLTVPFWSMPENTEHPTQKPEKLLAKIILASSKAGDIVFDPFCGSGTTSVAARKLGRNFVGVEMDEMYCCLAEKRLALADLDKTIQGYSDGVFFERNTKAEQKVRRR